MARHCAQLKRHLKLASAQRELQTARAETPHPVRSPSDEISQRRLCTTAIHGNFPTFEVICSLTGVSSRPRCFSSPEIKLLLRIPIIVGKTEAHALVALQQ